MVVLINTSRKSSYGDALRHFNQAIDYFSKAVGKDEDLRRYSKHAFIHLLRSLILLKGHGYPSYTDLVSLGAVAKDLHIIDEEEYGSLVELNLKLNGFGILERVEIIKLFRRLVMKAEELDPYLSQQSTLFRY